MIQEIITYIIVAVAVAYAVYKVVGLFKSKKSGCGGDCGCDAKDKLLKKK